MSLKPIIKSAREALDQKDYAYALQLCTDALAFEPENYWLLVFKGVALNGEGMTEKALVQYFKAAKVQEENPVAFQGIINLYEETSNNLVLDDRYHSALESLCQILFKQKEYEKHLALMRKRLNILKKEDNQTHKIIEILDWLSSESAKNFYPQNILPNPLIFLQEQYDLLSQVESSKIAKEIESGRLRLNSTDPLDKLIDRTEVLNYDNQLTEILRKLSKESPQKYLEIFSRRLLRIVLSDFCVDEKIRETLAEELINLSINTNASEIITCPTIEFINYITLTQSELNTDITRISNELPFTSPKIIFETIQEASQNSEYERVLKLYDDFEASLKIWQRAFSFVSFSSIQNEALKYKLKSLISLNYQEDALEFSKQFTNQDLLDDFLFEPILKILESLRQLSRAISLIEQKLMLIDPDHPGLILRLIDDLIAGQRYPEAIEYLDAIPAAYPCLDLETEAHLSFSTGLTAWCTSDRTKSTLSNFLSAAKADPEKSIYFLWIAKFYWRVEKDESRSLKCLLKALSLESSNLDAALLYSEIVLETNESNSSIHVINLLQPFTKISYQSRNRRLFYYYGIALFYSSSFIEASVAFQSALKGNHLLYNENNSEPIVSDELCLNWIGESFLRSKRLGSALKAFTRLASQMPTSKTAQILSKVGLAAVHLLSNNPIEAIDCLDSISDLEPNSLMFEKVQLDKSEAFLSLARRYLLQGRFISAMKAVLKCLRISTTLKMTTSAESLRISSDAFGLANCYKNICEFPIAEFKEISIRFNCLEINSGLSEIQNCIEKEEASDELNLSVASVKFALAALSMAFKETKKHFIATYWLQLAVSLSKFESCIEFSQSAASMALEASGDRKEINSQAHHLKSQLYLRSKTLRQAQHHLIVALKQNETAQLWIDLGRFYRLAGDWELATEALKKALSIDQENLVAAFELAQGSGTIEGNEGALQVAQRAFSTQPVHFTESFAWALAKTSLSSMSKISNYALVYLKKRYSNDLQVSELLAAKLQALGITKDCALDTTRSLSISCYERLQALNSSDNNWNLWLNTENLILDCEFLLKRPENEFTQSGWRAVVEGLVPLCTERTKTELEDLHDNNDR